MIKQNTYERKYRKHIIPEALITNREKEIKEEPIQKKTNKKPCNFSNAPNWNPSHECPALHNVCNNCGRKGLLHKHAAKKRTTNGEYVMSPKKIQQ